MRMRPAACAAALALLSACTTAAPRAPANQTVEAAATPAPAPPAAPAEASDLRPWLIGAWSFEASCSTDFIVHYNADGSLDNAGNVGTWTIAGDKITETVVQKLDETGEGTQKVNPPEVITYAVARIDPTHGSLRFQGRDVPILRC